MNSMIVEAIYTLHRHLGAGGRERDQLLPLDGRDWTRLVNMRIQAARSALACLVMRADFLTILRSADSPLRRLRDSNRRAICHWFLRGQEVYQSSWKAQFKPSYSWSMADTLAKMGNTKMALEEFERVWQTPEEKHISAKADPYWDSKLNEFWAGRDKEISVTRRLQLGVGPAGT